MAKICLPRIRCGPIYVSLIALLSITVTESEPLDTWDDEETLLTPDAEDDEVSKSERRVVKSDSTNCIQH